MRVYVGVQPTPQGGASSLSNYIAKSKVDSEREQLTESGVRPLFSAHQDRLTLKEADQTLNPTGKELEKEEVIHVVISPEPGSLDRAGDDPAEKYKAVRETIRATVRVMERVLNVKSLLWIAGFHQNTKTPHVHVAVSRWALDAVTEKLRYIKHLPKSLLPHNTEDAGGERRFLVGKIAEVFISALVQKLKPIRSVQIIDTLHGVDVNRSVASRYAQMLRGPTSEQLTVGQWLEGALMFATGKTGELSRDELLKQYSELTSEVARIDALARANGARPPVAYIAPERLEELVNGKAPNVQIIVSSTQPRVQDEKYVTVNNEQLPVVSKDQATKVETTQHENDKALAVPHQQGEDRKSSQPAPERVAKGRESNQERQEPRHIERPQVQKTREPMNDQSNVKSEEQPRVGKFTLLDLRSQIQQGSVPLPKPEVIAPSNTQIHPVAVTKTDNGESKFGSDAPVRVINATNGIPISIEHAPQTLDENHNIAPQEPPEWQIDDDDLRRLAGIAFVHFHQESDSARGRTTQKGATRSTFDVSSDYSSLGPGLERARYREAEIINTICQNACHERKLMPDVEGANRYLIGQIRAGKDPIVALMEQMNIVRDDLEDITVPSDRHLLEEFERLHDLHSQLRPKVEYTHEIYQTRDRELELEDHTHIP
jgi:hypothetical protein